LHETKVEFISFHFESPSIQKDSPVIYPNKLAGKIRHHFTDSTQECYVGSTWNIVTPPNLQMYCTVNSCEH